eukprot:5316957-Prymnesium_polylepis.1
MVVEQRLDRLLVEAWQRQRGKLGVLRVRAQDGGELLHERLLPLLRLARVAQQPQEEGDRQLDAAQRRAVAAEGEVHVVLDVRPALGRVHREGGR